MKMQESGINYNKIFSDPYKKGECQTFLQKKTLTSFDIIELNHRIFGINNKENTDFNQKHRSYSKSDIFKILDHQKKHKLNNSQLASCFGLSRNTISKWKKMFLT